jgi:hypothetical protein
MCRYLRGDGRRSAQQQGARQARARHHMRHMPLIGCPAGRRRMSDSDGCGRAVIIMIDVDVVHMSSFSIVAPPRAGG